MTNCLCHHLNNLIKRSFEENLSGRTLEQFRKCESIFRICDKTLTAREGEYSCLNEFLTHTEISEEMAIFSAQWASNCLGTIDDEVKERAKG